MRVHTQPRGLVIATDGLELPLDVVTQKLGLLGRSGSGKTFGAGRLCEGLLDAGAQVVIVDPVGVWWGLRLAADGKAPGIAIPVFGGQHGDVPLEAPGGSLVADVVVDHGVSLVLDVSEFTGADQRRFVTDFATRLLHRKKTARSPLMVVWEEAQEFVPQHVRGDVAKLVGAMERLIKLGRNFGIGTTLISQRPQSVNKDVLNQTECLIVLQLTGPQERKAVEGWIAEKGLERDLLEGLPALQVGHALLWSPQWLRLFREFHFARKRTFDASATPTFGTEQRSRELAPIDLEQVKTAMAGTIERAKENDPAHLRAELRKARTELQRVQVQPAVAPAPAPTPKAVPVIDAKARQAITALAARLKSVQDVYDLVLAGCDQVGAELRRIEIAVTAPPARPRPAAVSTPAPTLRARPALTRAPIEDGGAVHLRAGERRMLEVLARSYPARRTRAQIGTLSGFTPSGGTFQAYYRTLRRGGLLTEEGDGSVLISAAGLELVGGAPAGPQTTAETLETWRRALRAGERTMLDHLVRVYPRGLSREELGALTDFTASGGTFQAYLGTLRRNGLAEVDGEEIRAGAVLFLDGGSR